MLSTQLQNPRVRKPNLVETKKWPALRKVRQAVMFAGAGTRVVSEMERAGIGALRAMDRSFLKAPGSCSCQIGCFGTPGDGGPANEPAWVPGP